MAPAESAQLPGARTKRSNLLITTESNAPALRPTIEKTPRPCAGCGEPSGSISAGTGYPVVRERSTGRYFHVRCRPGTPSGAAAVVIGSAGSFP